MIIDTDNYEASGVKVFTFPGGEIHVALPKIHEDEKVTIHAKLRTWDDVDSKQWLGYVLMVSCVP